MFGKIAAGLSVIALVLGGLAFYRTTQPQIVEASIPGESIRAYLLENPQVVMEAAAAFEQQQKERAAAADGELIAELTEEVFNDGYSLVGGNPEGDLTLVEFSDYNCGYCKRAHGEVAKLLEQDGNIRLVVKEFPILGEGSLIAARAALASAAQGEGKYAEFSDALMAHRGSHSEATVMATAEKVGLDTDQLKEDMGSESVDAQIKRNYALAQKFNINGTPAFIIGDQVVRGFVPADRLQAIAEEARKEG